MTLDRSSTFQHPFLVILAGFGLTFAFAPYHWHLLALLCPALLLWSISHHAPRQAGLMGLIFGLCFFSTSVYWIYISIHQYGEMAAWQALFASGLFVLVLALFPAAVCYSYARLGPESLVKRVLVFPALWVLSEWLRSTLFTGFPWVLLGVSQTEGVLRHIATLFGVPAVSFCLCLCAGLMVHFLKTEREEPVLLLSGILVIWLGAFALDFIQWVQVDPQPIKATLVQGNIPPYRQWSEELVTQSIDRYSKLSQSHWDSDIIVWPENAIPQPAQSAQLILAKLSNFARNNDLAIITGIPTESEIPGFYYNSVTAIGNGQGHYHKRNLVPFGEYSPYLRQLIGVYQRLGIPLSMFKQGPAKQSNLTAKGLSIAAYICYEIAYSSTVLNDLPQANLIVTLSNDGWFGESIASAQHLQIGRMRSIQTQRYQLFSTNTGTTAIINPKGQVTQQAPSFTQTTIQGIVHKTTGSTPWIWWGDTPCYLWCVLLILYQLTLAVIRPIQLQAA